MYTASSSTFERKEKWLIYCSRMSTTPVASCGPSVKELRHDQGAGRSAGAQNGGKKPFFVKGPSPLNMVKEIAPKFTFFVCHGCERDNDTRRGKIKKGFLKKKKRVSLVGRLKICTVDILKFKFATYC
jgi:hypothetical protein